MTHDAVVHVVDDDMAVRQSLAFLLASEGFPVRLYESASEFLRTATSGHAGCIITDVRMPGIDGMEFLARLRTAGMTIPVVVMTGHADIALAVEAMKRGAVDFIEKPFDDEMLLGIVRQALARQSEHAAQGAALLAVVERLKTLTERESQVLRCLVAGKPNKIIAFELGISPRTVELYRANVMSKTQAKSLSELVRMVLLTQKD